MTFTKKPLLGANPIKLGFDYMFYSFLVKGEAEWILLDDSF
jgi:hypothetical protein